VIHKVIKYYQSKKQGEKMKLSAPKTVTWWIAVVLGVLGILGNFVTLPFVSGLSFWLVAIGFVLLALATYLKDL
jgi:nicotinamide riboside transporter PnuC